jgi:antitoxin (DNA-binding transcriptional repressor) of toxin-antitoxin stability system
MLEAKTHLSKLVEAALRGEEVVIANRGRPMVGLVRAGVPAKRVAGAWAGLDDRRRDRPRVFAGGRCRARARVAGRDYNLLFKTPKAPKAGKSGKAHQPSFDFQRDDCATSHFEREPDQRVAGDDVRSRPSNCQAVARSGRWGALRKEVKVEPAAAG